MTRSPLKRSLWTSRFLSTFCLFFCCNNLFPQESVKKNGLLEQEAVAMIWSAVMSACEWNKKEDLVHEQVNNISRIFALHRYISVGWGSSVWERVWEGLI